MNINKAKKRLEKHVFIALTPVGQQTPVHCQNVMLFAHLDF
jgi:hypothetical protein